MRLLLVSIHWCEIQCLKILVLCAPNSRWSFPSGALYPLGHEPFMSNQINMSEDSQTVVGATTKLSLNESESLSFSPIPTPADTLLLQQSDQSIIDFLAKPIYIASGVMSNLDVRGTLSFSSTIGPNLTGIDVWNQKLKGIYNIKATLVVDLIVNASAFHQGALLINYLPCDNVMPMSRAMRAFDLNGQSQLPGSMICNINKEHYRLEIPYISPQEMYPLRDSDAVDWGRFNVWVWSPLQTGAAGIQNVTFGVWFSWKDVVLGAPYPQAMGGRRAPIVKRVLSDRESNEGKGSISSIFTRLSNATGELAGIPVLSGVLAPVSWATSIMSKVASAFGYSKPIVSDTISRVTSLLHHYSINSIGVDNSAMLCATSDAKLQAIDGKTINCVDEMSIDFIKSRPAYWTNITLTTGQAVGLQVTSINMSPINFTTVVLYGTIFFTQYTPLAWLGKLFYNYTGSITLKFKFFKTAFHAGQFMISFAPRSPGVLTLNQTAPLHREFVDLQTMDELIITFPYTIAQPFLTTNDRYGTVYFHIVTPLRAPESVSQTIDCTIEVLGASDLKFANPAPDVPMPVIAQGAIDLEEEEKVVTTVVGTASTVGDTLSLAQVAVGEQLESIKQLILRPTRVQTNTVNFGFNVTNMFWFRPAVVCTPIRNGAINFLPPSYYASLVDKFAFCFVFRRGGNRWRFFRNSVSSGGDILCNMQHEAPNGDLTGLGNGNYTPNVLTSNSVAGTASYFSHNLTSFSGKEGGAALEVPHMSKYSVSVNEPARDGAITPYGSTTVVAIRSDNNANDLYVTRAVSDDFQFLFWLGVPLLYPDAIDP